MCGIPAIDSTLRDLQPSARAISVPGHQRSQRRDIATPNGLGFGIGLADASAWMLRRLNRRVSIPIALKAELKPAECRLGGLRHHVLTAAGADQPSVAGHGRTFNERGVGAHGHPSRPGNMPDTDGRSVTSGSKRSVPSIAYRSTGPRRIWQLWPEATCAAIVSAGIVAILTCLQCFATLADRVGQPTVNSRDGTALLLFDLRIFCLATQHGVWRARAAGPGLAVLEAAYCVPRPAFLAMQVHLPVFAPGE